MDSKLSHRRVLSLAALYNLLFGAWVILFPHSLFDWAELPRPHYPEIWQCVGMIVGVYGVGYWIASWNPLRHWPIVLVGLLGKILGPIGFGYALWTQTLNTKFGMILLSNDLIWWIPFGWILWAAFRSSEQRWIQLPKKTLNELSLPDGRPVSEVSQSHPLLFVLLRHSGCTFCRETLHHLSQNQSSITSREIQLVVVHMGDESTSRELARRYSLEKAIWISDPQKQFYSAFELKRGTLQQLFGWRIWVRGISAGILHRHGVGGLDGDGFQLGGSFLVHQGKTQVVHIQKNASDIDNWKQFNPEMELLS